MRDMPLSKVYTVLEPGPVVLLTTARNGRANVMTMSWHMMVEFEPPLIACVVSSADHSFAALRATRECVIAVPPVEIAEKVVQVGNASGRDIDKFEAFGLTPLPAAPLIAECFVNLECRIADTRLVNRYNLFVLEVLKAWTAPRRKTPKTIHHRGHGTFTVDGADHVKGKTIVVTGAGGGFGRLISQKAAARGANVVCGDVNEEGLAETVKLGAGAGGKASAKVTDVTDLAAMKALVAHHRPRRRRLYPLSYGMPGIGFHPYTA